MKHVTISASLSKVLCFLVFTSLIAGCSSGPEKQKPVQLPLNIDLIGVKLAWSSVAGPVDYSLDAKVNGNTVVVASSDGAVNAYDALTGASVWQGKLGDQIAAAIGTDGHWSALVTRGNDLVILESGREVWRQRLQAQSFTPPLVAGERVFVLLADKSVLAFDAQSGRKLWVQQRGGESLVLRQAGILTTYGDTLVVGLGGRLVGMNPGNGNARWDVPVASARGTNDVERLIDLIGAVTRHGEAICARAFQAAVGCVNAAKGNLLWNKPATGFTGLAGDDTHVYGAESSGKLIAWRRTDGERVWTSDSLLHRTLTAPLVVGRSVVVGDDSGLVHFISRQDGTVLARVATDGSAIAATPVIAGGTLVVVTRKGGIFGFKPE